MNNEALQINPSVPDALLEWQFYTSLRNCTKTFGATETLVSTFAV